MKYRPILFSGPMVRALLDGSKTQTRRVVKPQFAHDAIPCEMGATNKRGHQISGHSGMWWCDAEGNHDNAVRCPYGQPGDRLWVREAWAESDMADGTPVIAYRAGGCIAIGKNDPHGPDYLIRAYTFNEDVHAEAWRPSIHMPRWASRITLEVTGVRVERLQDISEADAIAEGVKNSLHLPGGRFARENFAHLWWTINGDGSWEANPWVWVIEFKRVEGSAT